MFYANSKRIKRTFHAKVLRAKLLREKLNFGLKKQKHFLMLVYMMVRFTYVAMSLNLH